MRLDLFEIVTKTLYFYTLQTKRQTDRLLEIAAIEACQKFL